MKTIAGYLLGSVVLALVAAVCLAAGLLDRDMAHAEQSLMAMKYDEPDQTLATAERYFEYGSRLPWIGAGPLNDVRARRAALQYWQRQYGAIVPQQDDPVSSVPADNIELQLIVANATYRAGQAVAKDRQTILQALDAGIQAYDTVLKNAARQEDAAHNYEYLVRLRDEILKGRRKQLTDPEVNQPHGRAGGPPPESPDASQFKIYIPLESEEREKAGDAGRAAPIRRRG
jgi:hypothetical protein